MCRRCACGDRACVYAEASTSLTASDDAGDASQTAADTADGSSKKNSFAHAARIQVSSLIHPDQSTQAAHPSGSTSSYFSPPQGVGPSAYSQPYRPSESYSPQSPYDPIDPHAPYLHRNGGARASTSTHHDRYRHKHAASEDLYARSGSNRHTSSEYDHHRPHAQSHPNPASFAASSIDISKVKLPELPPGLGFDHLDAYFPTYEQQCLFRHYILEVAPQLCVMRIPLSDNRWIRYHATFAVRHPAGTNGYEDALRSALLSMASLDIGHKLSQAPIPDPFPAVESRPDYSRSLQQRLVMTVEVI